MDRTDQRESQAAIGMRLAWTRRSALTHFRQETEALLKAKAAPLADVSLPNRPKRTTTGARTFWREGETAQSIADFSEAIRVGPATWGTSSPGPGASTR